MTEEKQQIDKKWYKTSRNIVRAGNMPFPAQNPTLIELLQLLITEEQADFITDAFRRKPNLSMVEIKERVDLDESTIRELLEELMKNGVVTETQSKSTGIVVYRLMPPYPGMFEFTLMRGETGKKQEKLAQLFNQLFDELSELTQENYDTVVPQYKNFPAVDRIIPVEKEISNIPSETVLDNEDVTKIIDKYDDIALVHCYCRHEKDLLGEPCKVTDLRENCFLFGKTAKFAIEKEFGRPIDKKEAKEIIELSEEDGLVHTVFHVHLDVDREEEALCNCCKCCCGVIQMYHKGIMPYHCYTSYIPEFHEEDCIGCGICVSKCPMDAIKLEDAIAIFDETRCIGCSVCVHNCPEEAITLKRTGLREVFVPPPKRKKT
ncbi:MAG: hypothetical protein EU547_06360 [Promethearchaeota archaeon]|nr:MAG: hypothetical protein EU547_06360 [Candidatus Lokiarchaeota archaeon]